MSDQMEFRAIDVPDHERFTMIYDDVWHALKGTSQLSVYMAIKRRTNPGNHSWFGTRKELAAEAGVSLGTFQRGIKHLEKIGLIKVVPRFVPAKWDKDPKKIVHKRDAEHPYQIANLYLLRFHLPTNNEPDTRTKNDPPAETRTKIDPPLLPKYDPPLGIKIGTQTYIPNNINTSDIETNKDMRIPDGKRVNPAQGELVQTAAATPAQPSEQKKPANKYPADFEEWYAQYPRKKAKGDALKAYKAARKLVGQQELVEKTAKYARYVEQSGMEPRFVPYPATWLRAAQWDDEQDVQAPNSSAVGAAGGRTQGAMDIARRMIFEQGYGQNTAGQANTNHRELNW